MSSDPNYQWEDLLDIDDSDLPLTHVLHLYNRHVRIVQLAKIRKKLDIHEGGDDSVLSTQEYMKQVVEDVGEDEDFNNGSWVGATEYVKANGGIVSGCLRDIETFLKNGKLEQVVAIIKSCSLNALDDLKVTVKDLSGSAIILANVLIFSPISSMHYLNITKKNMVKVFHKDFIPGNGSGVGGSRMLMEEEEIVKLKFDEEALDLVSEEEARKSRAHEESLEKCRQQEEEDAEHERLLLAKGGGVLRALGANKAITHPVIAIFFLYPVGVVEAVFALEVDAMGALDLVEVEAVGDLDLMEVEVVGALDLIELEKNMVKVFHKDFIPGNGSGVGGSRMLMEEEEIVKLKFDKEALDLVSEEEARKSRAHEESLEKCRQQEEEDAEHERLLLGFHGTI
nr:hypothetical protein [Tanacetum cinerariifolium]